MSIHLLSCDKTYINQLNVIVTTSILAFQSYVILLSQVCSVVMKYKQSKVMTSLPLTMSSERLLSCFTAT